MRLLGVVAMSAAERAARYRARHPERVLDSDRRSRAARPEHFRVKYRRQYARNAEKRAAEAQARRDKDRATYNAMVRTRRALHPEKNRAAMENRRARIGGGKVTPNDVLLQFEAQGGVCVYCHQELDATYEIDHAIPLARGGVHDPSNIVLACAKCNRRKNKLTADEFIAKMQKAAA